MTALEFLMAIHPKGPWVITAINPEQTGDRTDTMTFFSGEETEARAFVDKYNGKWNLYFTGNRIGRKMRKKPERVDIEWLDHLHVDLDPNRWTDDLKITPEEFMKEEQDRILALLTEKLPPGVPPPSFIIFSGGGYQAFWKLKEPLKLDGTLEMAEEVKLYNVALEEAFKADHCHNIDRIMRLPGTWNVPTPAKIKKGRTKVEAGIVYFEPEQTYDISQFAKAVKVQTKGTFDSTSGSPIEVDVTPGNIEQLADVHELDKHTADKLPLEDRVKRIIQFGYDTLDDSPNAKPKDGRSEWVLDAVCAMVRRGIPDQLILSVLLDRDFRISDHIYDQKQGAEKSAIRQIKRAKEFTTDPTLAELNAKYAMTTIGDKAMILWEDEEKLYHDDKKATPVVRYLKPEAFKALWCNRVVQDGTNAQGDPKFTEMGTWWIKHPLRRSFRGGVYFKPSDVDVPEKYNLWRGFAMKPAPGNGHEGFLRHIRENVCSGNEEYYTYLIKWFAHMFQKPAELAHVAVVLQGDVGVGKSFVPNEVGKLLGHHYIQVSSSKHLVGNFNAHLQDKLLNFADEAFFHGDKSSQSTLKTMITEKMRMVEKKGFDVQIAVNYTRLIMASNDQHVINAASRERRYFVLKVPSTRKEDAPYFKAIAKELEDGGHANLLHFFLNLDISDFDPRQRPITEELHRQTQLSMAPHIEWWLNCLIDGKVHPKHDGWMDGGCPKDDAFDAYADYMKKLSVYRPLNKQGLFKHLLEVMPSLVTQQRTVDVIVPSNLDGPEWTPVKQKRRVHCYILPPLERARQLFEERYGPQEWSNSLLQSEDGDSSD